MVSALGALDRMLFVVPSLRLIVVRTGQATPARDFKEQLWSRLTKALPSADQSRWTGRQVSLPKGSLFAGVPVETGD